MPAASIKPLFLEMDKIICTGPSTAFRVSSVGTQGPASGRAPLDAPTLQILAPRRQINLQRVDRACLVSFAYGEASSPELSKHG